ncbi:ammonium transporter [Trifolium pratense]|uniref:Ammonium transporter n=1 Tax=Trifolium pratense TaxID=57577 RepID=A0A2K3PES8_TRIPR|nr:ammonium transporter [Trifolium pratense]
MASLHLLPSLSKSLSSISPLSQYHTHPFASTTSLRFAHTITSTNTSFPTKPLSLRFALTESNTPNSTQPDPKTLLQEIADSFDLPVDYFAQFPSDLRLDLNDAAFDLSNGPILDECGKELGEILLNLSRAWELADTSTSRSLAAKLPLIEANLTGTAKSALGRRLVSAGRRFQSMGQYGQGITN